MKQTIRIQIRVLGMNWDIINIQGDSNPNLVLKCGLVEPFVATLALGSQPRQGLARVRDKREA